MLVAYAKADSSVCYGISMVTSESTNTFYITPHLDASELRKANDVRS
jgi:hypothetical protein